MLGAFWLVRMKSVALRDPRPEDGRTGVGRLKRGNNFASGTGWAGPSLFKFPSKYRTRGENVVKRD